MNHDLLNNKPDDNINETQEWCEAIEAVIKHQGPDRAQYLLNRLNGVSAHHGVMAPITTDYVNTIAYQHQPAYPGDLVLEEKISHAIRWNAVMMVLNAGHQTPDVGGHLGTYASSSSLYEVGFHHCFKAKSATCAGDFLFIQGHSSPGIYARAFLEGRLSEAQLGNFRQEIEKNGLSSYPHPWLMPAFWQFPTVSMGLGPLQAIYQARFLKYLCARDFLKHQDRKVWAFLGDGECDEVESLGALPFAAREGLDNLIFVINCNMQRLDGPVQGNGKIIQSLEGTFRGAGWNVIKVIWSSEWDSLLAADHTGKLKQRLNEIVDGDYLSYQASQDGAFIRANLFGKYPETLELVKDLSDEQLLALGRGGHDNAKIYAAYQAAMAHTGRPTVILAKTVKGYLLPSEGLNTIHNLKKMDISGLQILRDRLKIPLTDDVLADYPWYQPGATSSEIHYLQQHRADLGGYLPKRHYQHQAIQSPALPVFEALLKGTGEREISSTMAFVRILGLLLKDKTFGSRIVPIVPDESRTFGMEGLFKQIGIYSPIEQRYRPTDADQMMSYRESTTGQLLEEGINEAGAMCSWLAAATSYANNDVPMIPFYIFYSMFGFQRVGDLCWAAGDMRAKGFLLGATAGRTTLAGEGLQHQDGHNLLLAATVPNCVAYDPCYAFELAVIIKDGIERMMHKDESIYYYITVMNENYPHPAMPDGVETGILKGLYLLTKSTVNNAQLNINLLGSGTILREVEKAAVWLEHEHGIAANVWSAPGFNELRKEALSCERYNLFHPCETPRLSYVKQCLPDKSIPVIAATDYIKAYPDQIRQWIPARFTVLGTDGFGRSDGRAALRHFFEVDYRYIALAALKALADDGAIPMTTVQEALVTLGLNADKANPVLV